MSTNLPGQTGAEGFRGQLARYEMRVRTVLSAALVDSFPIRCTGRAVPRGTVHRIRVRGDRDLAEVVQKLSAHGAEVLDIRPSGCPPRESGARTTGPDQGRRRPVPLIIALTAAVAAALPSTTVSAWSRYRLTR